MIGQTKAEDSSVGQIMKTTKESHITDSHNDYVFLSHTTT